METYAPLNVIKPVDRDIWIVDGGNISFYGLPFPTRMTIIRLTNGDLFLHSPVNVTKELLDNATKLGRPAHLVSPNWIHYAYIADWADAFPDARCWASPNVRDRAAKAGTNVAFDCDLGEQADPAWAEDMEQLIVHGSPVHTEVVFFHKSSRTLILTDLIENFETFKIPIWFRPLAWMAGILDPNGRMPIDMRISFFRGRAELRRAIKMMIGWAPEKIILAHGRWYHKDGVAELKRAYRWLLK
jgi:uncharacterized protein DUF4336